MTNFTWTVKFLKQDDRGYATSLLCELSGTDGDKTKIAAVTSSFGGDDYKPYTLWTQNDIDAWAESHRQSLEDQIKEQLK